MATDAQNLLIAGDARIRVAPEGTSLPASLNDTLDVAFVDVGYTHEDGVTLAIERSFNRVGAHQTASALRMALTEEDLTFAFALREFKAENIKLIFGDAAVTEPTVGEYRYTYTEGRAPIIRALVVDLVDGASLVRICMPRAQLTEIGEIAFGPEDGASPELTFHKLAGDLTIDSNLTSWQPAGS